MDEVLLHESASEGLASGHMCRWLTLNLRGVRADAPFDRGKWVMYVKCKTFRCHFTWQNIWNCNDIVSSHKYHLNHTLNVQYLEVSDLGQCSVVFHISQQACVYMTGVRGVTSDDLHMCEAWPRGKAAPSSLRKLKTDSAAQTDDADFTGWQSDVLVGMPAVKSHPVSGFMHTVSHVCHKSWNLSEQICDAHCLKVSVQPVLFSPACYKQGSSLMDS